MKSIVDYDGLETGIGLILSHGKTWRESRKTVGFCLHDFKTMEHLIQDQVDLTIEAIETKFSKTGSSISSDDLLFAEPLVACIWSVITKSPMDLDQNKKLSKDIYDFAQEFVSPLAQAVQHNRGLFYLTENLGLSHLLELHQQIKRQIKQYLSDSKNKAEESLMKGFMNENNSSLNEQNFSDLLLVGSYSLWVHLQWGLICLIKNPKWQSILRKESGQEYMPLTEAFVSEVLRTFVVRSKGLSYPMLTTDDIKIRNYFLPKGTVILHMLSEVMQDPQSFPDPQKFDPDRFVSNKNHPRLIPFGVGKRKCIAENVARMILKSFLSNLVERYEISSNEDIKLGFNDAAIAKPNTFNVFFKQY